jgi:nicotinamidase-related amidase
MTVIKRGISAFAGTELGYLLRLKDVNTVVLTGIATNFVVEGTARDAVDRGYSAVVIEDCCQTHSDEAQRFSLEIMSYLGSVVSLDEFLAAILPA